MLIRLLLIACLSFGALSINADDVDDSSESDDPTLVGNYRPANTLDDNLQQAAAFAVGQIGKGDLVELVSAESQVVAGTNYKFKFIISMADGSQHLFSAIVFVPLPSTGDSMQLIEYQDLGVNPTVQ